MRVKYTMAATLTTNITQKVLKEEYGGSDIGEAIRIDIANFIDDPYMFLDDEKTKIDVFGEVIGK